MPLRQTLKRTLQRTGLHGLSVRARQALSPTRLRYRGVTRHTSTPGGVSVTFSTEDDYSNRWFFPRYAGGRLHERAVTEALVRSLRGAEVFVDAGANLGWYTCVAARHMPEGEVVAFEMDAVNHGLLRRNVALNALANVEAHHAAVSDSVGVTSYPRSSSRPNAMLSMRRTASGEAPDRLETVPTTALDSFFRDRRAPDVLKIDVEGAEMHVLRGMTRILADARPVLFLEIHPNHLGAFNTSAQEVLSFLSERGYRVSAFDAIRDADADQPLLPVERADQIVGNAMLYAVHESHPASGGF